MKSSASVAYLYLCGAAFLWAGHSVAARAIAFDIDPVALAFWRWIIALPILYPFVRGELRRERALIVRHWKLLALLALISTAPNHAILYLALQYTTAINLQLFNSTIPVFVLVIQLVFLRMHPRLNESIGVLVSLAGVVVIIAAGDLARLAGLRFNFGDVLIIAAFLAWACYAVLLRFRPAGLSPFAFVFVVALLGVLWVVPALAWQAAAGAAWLPDSPRVWGWILFLAIGSSVLASAFQAAGVDRIGSQRASLFLHLIPVFGVGMAIAVLGERLAWYHGAGFALVLAGLWIANRQRAERHG